MQGKPPTPPPSPPTAWGSSRKAVICVARVWEGRRVGEVARTRTSSLKNPESGFRPCESICLRRRGRASHRSWLGKRWVGGWVGGWVIGLPSV